jgi:protein TonB
VNPTAESTRQNRTPYRPPLGIPKADEMPRMGAFVSVAIHVLVAVLVLVPFTTEVVQPILQGAGGAGPAGGGGGGRGGTGGTSEPMTKEGLRFIQVAPERPRADQPTVATPPEPIVPPKPAEVPRPVPPPTETKADTSASATTRPSPDVAVAPGSGGGSGTDGTNGSGPGSGGGVGTGVGTGRGSAVGPGTGGGTGANYPPQPIELYLQPMPIPERLRDFCIVAEFDVDENGRVLDLRFTDTKDGGYNRKLREMLRSIRFRPGSRPDGAPVRMTAQIQFNCRTPTSGAGAAH